MHREAKDGVTIVYAPGVDLGMSVFIFWIGTVPQLSRMCKYLDY